MVAVSKVDLFDWIHAPDATHRSGPQGCRRARACTEPASRYCRARSRVRKPIVPCMRQTPAQRSCPRLVARRIDGDAALTGVADGIPQRATRAQDVAALVLDPDHTGTQFGQVLARQRRPFVTDVKDD